eukprot:643851-Amphidinium_carterae.2
MSKWLRKQSPLHQNLALRISHVRHTALPYSYPNSGSPSIKGNGAKRCEQLSKLNETEAKGGPPNSQSPDLDQLLEASSQTEEKNTATSRHHDHTIQHDESVSCVWCTSCLKSRPRATQG